MKVSYSFVMVLGLLLSSASPTMADTAFPYVGSIEQANNVEASVYVLPDASGPPLTEAMEFGGQQIDATITVRLVDCWGTPIADFPWEDIWLETESEGSGPCYPLGFSAHSTTDNNGETNFSLSLAGGGWTEGPVWVYVVGGRALDPLDCPWGIEHPPVSLRFNSADINGDGIVNLVDTSLFSTDFFGPYQYRSDFYWDGVLNLADIARMAAGIGLSCD